MAGGGIGEAMLISAAVGGGTAIATGQDPLKGALMGGLAGGVGGALLGPASGAASGTAQGAAGPTVAGAATTAPTTAAIGSAAPSSTGALSAGAGAGGLPEFGMNANQALSSVGVQGNLPQMSNLDLNRTFAPKFASAPVAPVAPMAPGLDSLQSAANSSLIPVRDLSNSAMNLGGTEVASNTANQGIMGRLGDWYGGLSTPEKIGVGIGGGVVASSLFAPDEELPTKRKSPFKYDWRKFRPTNAYAEGGITALAAENMGTGLNNPYTSNQGPLDQQAIQVVPQQQDNAYTSAPAAGYLGQSVKMMASGGISDLGGYSDGGRLLKGPGDGMSDHIPASIGGKQPARLADGEFVIPADVVSHLGNGSTDAGAKHLYKMMNKVRKARTGNSKQGKQINPAKYMAA